MSTRPEPGWVIFFNWAETPKEPFDHVRLVVGVNSNGSIRTIEGNTRRPTESVPTACSGRTEGSGPLATVPRPSGVDVIARMFPPTWVALMVVRDGGAIAYGHPDLAAIFLVGLPLVRGSVLLGVERWQAGHYAGLVGGGPEHHHPGWHYREAEELIRERHGRRCARWRRGRGRQCGWNSR